MSTKSITDARRLRLFLCGDVMTGRGVDQVLPYPGNPTLHEPFIKDSREYVKLAEVENGSIPKPVSYSYVWGDTLDELEKASPDLRIINLETSITNSEDYREDKGVHYRMNPLNAPAIMAAKIDLCVLANNHVLDWGHSGLIETLKTLREFKIKYAGAGLDLEEAESPIAIEVEGKGRVVVFAIGFPTSGIPLDWAATKNRPGINLLEELSNENIRRIAKKISTVRRDGDIVIASIHWGGNWGYAISAKEVEFAHGLVDQAGIDVIHGHSSHHIKGIEVYKDKPVLYGCGDFLDDYEGIGGFEEFRDALGLMYFVTMDPLTGKLIRLEMIPTQIMNFRVNRALRADALWLRDTLNREGNAFGTRVEINDDNIMTLHWN